MWVFTGVRRVGLQSVSYVQAWPGRTLSAVGPPAPLGSPEVAQKAGDAVLVETRMLPPGGSVL